MPRYSLATIIGALAVLWLIGWLLVPIAGNLIHLLLVVILGIVMIRFLQGGSLTP